MYNVYMIGTGPGGIQYLTGKAKETIEQCRFLTGADRILKSIEDCIHPEAQMYPLKSLDQCLTWVDQKQRQADVGILVSGDVHYYSFAGTVQRSGYSWNLVFLSGISSYQLMADKISVTLEDVELCSVHGRNETDGYIIHQITQKKKTMFLCSRDFPPERIGKALCNYGYEKLKIWIGSNLEMPNEDIFCLSAKQASEGSFSGMSVVYVENEQARSVRVSSYLRDTDFMRGQVPMTKEEIRILLLHKLQIGPEDCLWDLGAGTGTISIEMARQAVFGHVYSVEYKDEALRLIQKNKEKFQCNNLEIINGRIKDSIESLPEPDRVFLGGSEGELEFVVSYLKQLSGTVHFVMTAVTIETLSKAVQLFSENDTFQYVQIQIGRSRMVGSYHTTEMNHPIWILEVDL